MDQTLNSLTGNEVALLQSAADCCRAHGLRKEEALLLDIVDNERAGFALDVERRRKLQRKNAVDKLPRLPPY